MSAISYLQSNSSQSPLFSGVWVSYYKGAAMRWGLAVFLVFWITWTLIFMIGPFVKVIRNHPNVVIRFLLTTLIKFFITVVILLLDWYTFKPSIGIFHTIKPLCIVGAIVHMWMMESIPVDEVICNLSLQFLMVALLLELDYLLPWVIDPKLEDYAETTYHLNPSGFNKSTM